MSYALLQTTLMPPPVEALERAFREGRGLTPADARFVADDAFGFLARDLAEEDALFLQSALAAEGVQIEVVPESDLPRLPDHKLFLRVTCSDEGLAVYNALEQATAIPWASLRLITAGYDQKEIKLELFVDDADGERRFTTSVDRLQFERMPQFRDPRAPQNIGASFVYLVRDLAARAPHAQRNRAAAYLTKSELEGDITAGITYPRPGAYLEEIIWLLWNARRG